MFNISGFGTSVTVVALQTFPMGFNITEFADDQDPIDIPPIEPVGYQPLYDGSIVTFTKAAPIELTLSVIPGSEDDINLKILLQSRGVGPSILPFQDITTMVISYPDGGRVILTQGSILSGPVADSIIETARKKSNQYKFVFASVASMQSGRQTAATIAQNILGLL